MKKSIILLTSATGILISSIAVALPPQTNTATTYSLGSGSGACDFGPGHRSQYVVALNTGSQEFQYNNGINCGRYIKITNKSNDKSVVAEVVDRCADGSQWCNASQYASHIDMDEPTSHIIDAGYGKPNPTVTWKFVDAPAPAHAFVSDKWGSTWAVVIENTSNGISEIDYSTNPNGPFVPATREIGRGGQPTARFKVDTNNKNIVYIKAKDKDGKDIFTTPQQVS